MASPPDRRGAGSAAPGLRDGTALDVPAPGRAEDVHRALLQIVVEGGDLPEVAAGPGRPARRRRGHHGPRGRVLADAGDVGDLAQAYASTCFNAGGPVAHRGRGL